MENSACCPFVRKNFFVKLLHVNIFPHEIFPNYGNWGRKNVCFPSLIFILCNQLFHKKSMLASYKISQLQCTRQCMYTPTDRLDVHTMHQCCRQYTWSLDLLCAAKLAAAAQVFVDNYTKSWPPSRKCIEPGCHFRCITLKGFKVKKAVQVYMFSDCMRSRSK